ncbi:hypothetical protein FOA52_000436 [Chlamydomonas sp. UWO 241]|nr:hypothetical protein FOA52_000436 [Chlamydomonas sp. UWO 241]
MVTSEAPVPASASPEAGKTGDESRWQEVHALLVLDPVTDRPALLLLQGDIHLRAKMEAQISQLVNAQLGMLESMFPTHVLGGLLGNSDLSSTARQHEGVSVPFMDIVGFTTMSKLVPPTAVMAYLNALFYAFDKMCDQYGGVRAVMGFARAMLRVARSVRMPHNNEPSVVRVGIHTGSVVSGLIGSKLPKFSLFGDAMNTSSRMESTAPHSSIQVSATTYALMDEEQRSALRATGGVEVKGKGLMDTYVWDPSPADLELTLDDAELMSDDEDEETGTSSDAIHRNTLAHLGPLLTELIDSRGVAPGGDGSTLPSSIFLPATAWYASMRHPQTKRSLHLGIFVSEEDAARAYDFTAVQTHGPGAKRNFPDEDISEPPVSKGGRQKKQCDSSAMPAEMATSASGRAERSSAEAADAVAAARFVGEELAEGSRDDGQPFRGVQMHPLPESSGAPPESGGGAHAGRRQKSSRYRGVSWKTASSAWDVRMQDPQTKRSRCIGIYCSEEDAARAYDFAAMQAHGLGVKRNFPGEDICESPVSKGEERKRSSCYSGVTWHKGSSMWHAQLTGPQTKRSRHIGTYSSEEDAARAYDCAAVQAHGPGARRNFPGEDISELAGTAGPLDWGGAPPESGAYDFAAVQVHGPGAQRNFPGEDISETPVSKERMLSSSYVGVCWVEASSSWLVGLWNPETNRSRHIGSYASEEDAARAYDCVAVQAHGPAAKRNLSGEDISEPPETVGKARKMRRITSR